MKLCKRGIAAFLFGCALVSLCACQASPDKPVVVSKNDGAFNANAAVSAEETHAPDATQAVKVTDTFTSSDGSVNFSVTLDENLTDVDMPIVEVTPHYLTEEDVQNIYHALFGDTDCYCEREDEDSLTKSEILGKIDRWAPYTSGEAVRELYGRDIDWLPDLVKRFIEEYTLKLETAQNVERSDLCQWQFQEDTIIVGNMKINAELASGDIPYFFTAAKRNMSDYQLNSVWAYIEGGRGPDTLDNDIFRARLCRTSKPTEAQLSDIRDRAERMLAEMNIGQWMVDQCYVETRYFGEIPEYTVQVTAVPVFNGIPAARMPQLKNLKSEASFASRYYLTDVSFSFSADGKLVRFSLESPVDVKGIVNENTRVLSTEKLLSLVKEQLTLSDAYAYGYGMFAFPDSEDLNCDVNVSSIKYSLARVKVPDTDESYYYVPTVSVLGSVRITGKDSGDLYMEETSAEPLLILNAVDGSVINQTNS